jgi:hypothetical protein
MERTKTSAAFERMHSVGRLCSEAALHSETKEKVVDIIALAQRLDDCWYFSFVILEVPKELVFFIL